MLPSMSTSKPTKRSSLDSRQHTQEYRRGSLAQTRTAGKALGRRSMLGFAQQIQDTAIRIEVRGFGVDGSGIGGRVTVRSSLKSLRNPGFGPGSRPAPELKRPPAELQVSTGTPLSLSPAMLR